MGQGDHMPSGGHRKKHDPKHAQKIKEGGKKADAIRKKADEYHAANDVPIAENQLEKDLKQIS